MVIDAGKGIESQTRKLFEVCRQRGVPILTFVNKLDRPPRDPLELLDELESVLGIAAFAVDWPLGLGPDFRGLFDRRSKEVHLYERTPGGAYRAPVQVHDLASPQASALLPEGILDAARAELALLEGAGPAFNRAAVLAGDLTPVFFGSAVHTFGVDLLLDAILELAPPPRPRSAGERTVHPEDPRFSGFVFKIQANMDPKHRERVRLVLQALRQQLSQRPAFPGDVVGLVGQSSFRIGDTLADDPSLSIDGMPTFLPECFAWIHCAKPSMSKRFHKGLAQLLEEGVVQSYWVGGAQQRVPLLAAVGPLQFDVVRYRLESEYGAEARIEAAPWTTLRWIEDGDVRAGDLLTSSRLAQDSAGRRVILFESDWSCRHFGSSSPSVRLAAAPGARPDERRTRRPRGRAARSGELG
jgi:peptide chain release factor 3